MSTLKKLNYRTAAIILAGIIGAPTFALDVSDIDVSITPLAVSDTESRPYYTEISTDLKQMISELVTGGEGEGTVDIKVSIRNISLNGQPAGPNATDFNELGGVVSIHPAGEGRAVFTFEVGLAAYAEDRPLPDGFLRVSPSVDDYYRSLLSAFAQETAGGIESAPLASLQSEGETDF